MQCPPRSESQASGLVSQQRGHILAPEQSLAGAGKPQAAANTATANTAAPATPGIQSEPGPAPAVWDECKPFDVTNSLGQRGAYVGVVVQKLAHVSDEVECAQACLARYHSTTEVPCEYYTVRVVSRPISSQWGADSVSPAHLHVRPMWALSTCRWADEIKKSTHPKDVPLFLVIRSTTPVAATSRDRRGKILLCRTCSSRTGAADANNRPPQSPQQQHPRQRPPNPTSGGNLTWPKLPPLPLRPPGTGRRSRYLASAPKGKLA